MTKVTWPVGVIGLPVFLPGTLSTMMQLNKEPESEQNTELKQ